MIALDEAWQRILEQLEPPLTDVVAVTAAHRRVAATDVVSPLALPPFDTAGMDGYAVRSADTLGAAEAQPVALRCAGTVAAGDDRAGSVEAGSCIRVFTGAALPQGADAVVMQEDTRHSANGEGAVELLCAAAPWENVRFTGEDVKRGERLVRQGDRLTAGQLGLLAAAGVASIPVGRRPRVTLLATGNELVEPGTPLPRGHVYDSNRVTLGALATAAGAEVTASRRVGDSLEETVGALREAFAGADVVITSGGVSVGEADVVKRAIGELGAAVDFWKVAIKPGKPFAWGRWHGKHWFGLPGNPVSAFVTFMLLVRPALLRLQGARDVADKRYPATLAEPLSNPGDRTQFVRVRLRPDGQAILSGAQGSHIQSSLAQADGLVEVPPATRWPAGHSVSVRLLD